MRLTFDTRGRNDQRGIGRYVRSLFAALGETAPPDTEIIEAHRPRNAEVYHSPWLDGAMMRCPSPQVVTLHDVVALKRPGEYLRTGVRFRLRYMALQRAQRVIVPTRAVAGDVIERLEVDEDRVRVIPEAAVSEMYPRPSNEVAAARRRYGLPEDYLLWVGGLQHPDPRKRVAALASAPRSLPLVLAGPTKPWAHELPDVTLTGPVPDDHLAAIYSGARALVFPSDDEGFGLPTVEALACGTPVVACDVPALREVLAHRATFVDCEDIEGLVETAEQIRRPAPEAPRWTWTDAAHATWDVYNEAIEEGTG